MLELRNITKRFDGVPALLDVDLRLIPGRVHGVLGENGAGKSTLMGIAAGLLRPDAGRILCDGRELSVASPRHARQAGIAMVHQHFCLIPTLTVVENCVLGRPAFGQWLSRRAIGEQLGAMSRRLGLEVDPHARVESLSVGQQQRVEILRALIDARRVLILDEPTAVLTPQEVEHLFTAIARLRAEGLAVAFISHKLHEVRQICDDLTILRRGRRVFHGPAADLTTAAMAELMIGQPLPPPERADPAMLADMGWQEEARTSNGEPRLSPGDRQGPQPASACNGGRPSGPALRAEGPAGPIIRGSQVSETSPPAGGHAATRGRGPGLEIRGLRARDPASHRQIRELDLTVAGGEIVGIAGVEGNGQDVLVAVLAGVLRPSAGQVRLDGRDLTTGSVRERVAAGLAVIPEDRLKQALVPAMTLAENLVLKTFRQPPVSRYGLLRWSQVRTEARQLLAQFDVRPAVPDLPVQALSGGNQQKVVLARELGGRPRAVVAHNPARGLDVAATRFVFEQLLAQREGGAAVLLVHSDLDELLAIADRVVVMYAGRCLPTSWPACDRASIGRLMLEGRHP